MTIEPFVRAEWEAHGALDREACHSINDHADPGDQHPIVTAIAMLRAGPEETSITTGL